MFGAADQAVVERLAGDDGAGRAIEVGIGGDQGRRISGADANGRRPRAVRGLDQCPAPVASTSETIGMAHESPRDLAALLHDPLDESRRRAVHGRARRG